MALVTTSFLCQLQVFVARCVGIAAFFFVGGSYTSELMYWRVDAVLYYFYKPGNMIASEAKPLRSCKRLLILLA